MRLLAISTRVWVPLPRLLTWQVSGILRVYQLVRSSERLTCKLVLGTLEAPDGHIVTLKVGEQVRNLPQARPGDTVLARYYTSTAYVLAPPGTKLPNNSEAAASARAASGDKPGASVGSKVVVSGLVVAVDPTLHTVSLVDPAGGPGAVHECGNTGRAAKHEDYQDWRHHHCDHHQRRAGKCRVCSMMRSVSTVSFRRDLPVTPDQPNAAPTAEQRQNNHLSTSDLTRRVLFGLAIAAVLPLAACSSSQPIGQQSLNGRPPDGTVDMNQVQAAFIGSGGGGSGTLYYQGQSYPFAVGGLGIGGIGASTIDAKGEVYGLTRVADFPGAYAQGRYGFVFGNTSGGDLWLKNEKGVIMHLAAKRTGLMLSLGGDAVVISMQ